MTRRKNPSLRKQLWQMMPINDNITVSLNDYKENYIRQICNGGLRKYLLLINQELNNITITRIS